MDGERYLRELVDGFVRDLDGLTASDPKTSSFAGSLLLGQAEAVGRALVAAGLLQPQAYRDIVDPLKRLPIEAGVIEEVHGFASFSMEAHAVEGPIEPGPVKGVPQPRELRKVIPLVRSFDLPGDRSATLISLEVWTDQLTLNYEVQRAEFTSEERAALWKRDREPIGLQDLAWEITDDVGTSYRKSETGGSGGLRVVRWELGLQPAPPLDAKTLTLIGHDRETVGELLRVSVDL